MQLSDVWNFIFGVLISDPGYNFLFTTSNDTAVKETTWLSTDCCIGLQY